MSAQDTKAAIDQMAQDSYGKAVRVSSRSLWVCLFALAALIWVIQEFRSSDLVVGIATAGIAVVASVYVAGKLHETAVEKSHKVDPNA